MRIGFDGEPIVRHRGGVGWHIYHLLRALIGLKEPDVEFIGYLESGSRQRLTEPWMQDPYIQWREVYRVLMPLQGRADRLDLYHGMNFRMRTMGSAGGIVTIHDVWLDRFPQYSRKLFGQRLSRLRTRAIARRARRVITVSRHSADDIVALYGIPREHVVVIYNGVSEDFCPDLNPTAFAELRRRLPGLTERFILFLGGADPRKNHGALLQAYQLRKAEFKDYRLVLVGAKTHHFGNMPASVKRHELKECAVCTGPLSLQDLKILYSHAAAFVFPSLYEGFGMPLLEAMACGAPVIASATTSLPEIAGDAALLIDPRSPDEIADALMRVLHDPALRESLRAKGFARAKQFTWERAARETLAVYRQVAGDR